MRAVVRRALGPGFEALVSKFDPSIDPSEHPRFIEAMLSADALPEIQRFANAGAVIEWACSGLAIPVGPRPSASPDTNTREPLDDSLLTLLPPFDRAPDLSRVLDAAPVLTWEEAPEEQAAMFARLVSAAWAGRLAAEEGVRYAEAIAAALEPKRWFLAKRGVLPGSADALRFVLYVVREVSGVAGIEATRAYAEEVLERVLRHVEVKREDALELSATHGPGDEFLERLRFSHALLDAWNCFSDLRFLNLTLKTQDWHLRRLQRKPAGSRGAQWTPHFLFYLSAYARQERAMKHTFAR